MSTTRSTGKGAVTANPSVPNTSRENSTQKGAVQGGPAPSGSGSRIRVGDQARVPVPGARTGTTQKEKEKEKEKKLGSRTIQTKGPLALPLASSVGLSRRASGDSVDDSLAKSSTGIEEVTNATKIAIVSRAISGERMQGSGSETPTLELASTRMSALFFDITTKSLREELEEKKANFESAVKSLEDNKDVSKKGLYMAKLNLCLEQVITAEKRLIFHEQQGRGEVTESVTKEREAREEDFMAKVKTAEKIAELLADQVSAETKLSEAKARTKEHLEAKKDRSLEGDNELEVFKAEEALCEAQVSLCSAKLALAQRTTGSKIKVLENSVALNEAKVAWWKAQLRMADAVLAASKMQNQGDGSRAVRHRALMKRLRAEVKLCKAKYDRADHEHSYLEDGGKEGSSDLAGKYKVKKAELDAIVELHQVLYEHTEELAPSSPDVEEAERENRKSKEEYHRAYVALKTGIAENSADLADLENDSRKAKERFEKSERKLHEARHKMNINIIKLMDSRIESFSALEFSQLTFAQVLAYDKCVVKLPLYGLTSKSEEDLRAAGFEFDLSSCCEATPELFRIIKGEIKEPTDNVGEFEIYDFMSPFRAMFSAFDSENYTFGYNLTEPTSRGTDRPDFFVQLYKWIIARFKYKQSHDDLEDARKELIDKSEPWRFHTHGPVKSVLGVAVAKRSLSLVEIIAQDDSSRVSSIDVMKKEQFADLKTRLKFLKIILNICAYYATPLWTSKLNVREDPINAPKDVSSSMGRGTKNIIVMAAQDKGILYKTYKREGSNKRMEYLEKFYLITSGIEGLEHGKLFDKESNKFELTLRCFNVYPKDEDMKAVILQVASTLEAIHNLEWCHGDVRKPNIRPYYTLKRTTWTLIDCEFALPRRAIKGDQPKPYEYENFYYENDEEMKGWLSGEALKDPLLDVMMRNGSIDLAILDMRMLGELAKDQRFDDEEINTAIDDLKNKEDPLVRVEALNTLARINEQLRAGEEIM